MHPSPKTPVAKLPKVPSGPAPGATQNGGRVQQHEDAPDCRSCGASNAAGTSGRCDVCAQTQLVEYERCIDWHVTCSDCATLLDASYAQTVRAERAERLAEAYKRRLVQMHGHENAACAAQMIGAILHPSGASDQEMILAIRHALRIAPGTFEHNGMVGTFVHGCGNAHFPGEACT